jgi:lysophospholipase L1-like esterase
MWILLGVLVLLGGQPSEAGAGDHAQAQARGERRALGIQQYVAIGDSYTAGSGIPPGEQTGCWKSPRSYPHLVAKRIGATLHDASCGGATTEAVEAPQLLPGMELAPQAAPLDRRTDLVTISVGVNDADFAEILFHCSQIAPADPQGSPCRASYSSPQGDTLLSRIPPVGRKVQRVIRLVQEKSPEARVLVIGYPQLAPEHGTCPELPFAAGDYGYLREYIVDVDEALEEAARHTGVTYVDLLGPSRGHDICAGDDAWVLGAYSSPRTMIYHPFGNEHRAVAALVLAALADLGPVRSRA